jgi:hypothetical protein
LLRYNQVIDASVEMIVTVTCVDRRDDLRNPLGCFARGASSDPAHRGWPDLA